MTDQSCDSSDADGQSRRTAAALLAVDAASALFGIELVHAEPGTASVRMRVTEQMVNGHSILHGGLSFLLADTALAMASATRCHTAVSRLADIAFLQPAGVGDVLVATAREVHRRGRSTIYDVTVTNAADDVVALVRGHMTTLASTPAVS